MRLSTQYQKKTNSAQNPQVMAKRRRSETTVQAPFPRQPVTPHAHRGSNPESTVWTKFSSIATRSARLSS